jgi:glycerol-1-phosphate dehydrogenase [NAD(P)+]
MSDWHELLGMDEACDCGHTHTVPTREVIVESGALGRVEEVVRRHVTGRKAALIADETTWEVAGRTVADSLAGFSLKPTILKPEKPGHSLKADDWSERELAEQLPDDCDFVVCVGSGTLNDLAKMASTARKIPEICVGTAASMNGYPSAISAMSRAGIKCTEPCVPPVAIVCDTDIIAKAPARMAQAGLGDLLSKATSSTDWLMGHLLRDEYYCEKPVAVVEEAERLCREQAPALGRSEPQAVETLMIGLIQSGISMAMAGASSPASGGEHLISHYLDMTQEGWGWESDLHGRQVAVATLMTGRLYEFVRERTLKGVDVEAARARAIDLEQARQDSLAHFEPLLGTKVAEEIAQIMLTKAGPQGGGPSVIERLAADPQGFWQQVGRLMRPTDSTEHAYLLAGVPTKPADIGLTPKHARAAFLYGRHIRNRYTILDLASELGLLEEAADILCPV